MIKQLINQNFIEKQECSGCNACAQICPKQCIKMESDAEGFLYPVIDDKACIHCNMCNKVCRIEVPKEEISFEQKAYIVQLKDEKGRRESTSGGAFTAIAQNIINKKGIVYGAAYDDNFRVFHVGVGSNDELKRFRNSKYVQSFLGNTFSEIKNHLEQERWVCFSGTPCQVEGLKSFLGQDYDRLITVDLVCHAVSSPLVFEKYLKKQEKQYGKLSNIIFRDKHYGYQYSTMSLQDFNGRTIYAKGVEYDPMLRAFFSNICDRPSCYNCHFKKQYRDSDFTIWDCFKTHEISKEMDDNKGTSNLLIHTEKGKKIFNEINNIRFIELAPEDIIVRKSAMLRSVRINPRRESFMNSIIHEDKDGKTFVEYYPITISVKTRELCRVLLAKTRLYTIVKYTAKRIIHINRIK